MSILVSGATGFIGHSLVPALREAGYVVHQLTRYRAGRWDGYDLHALYFADLRDGDSLRKVVQMVRPEAVVHLAAQSAVSYSFQNPADVNATNYMGTIALAEACREAGVGHFVFASTSEVYGDQGENVPTREDAPLKATSPYAQSKINAEGYLQLMWDLHRFPVTIMRPHNSFGRALVDNRHFVVERAILGALQEGRIHLHDPRPRRDFLWRQDHVNGYLAALEKRPLGEAINLCTGKSWTIAEMAEVVAGTVAMETGREVCVDFAHAPDRPLDIPVLHGDNSKASELLGWYPRYSLEAGIAQAVREWRQRLSV